MWEIIKDVIAYLEWDTDEPLQISVSDTESYLHSRGIPDADFNEFRRISPRNLWRQTEGSAANYERHFELDQLRRKRREVVVVASNQIDLVLCRKRNSLHG